MGSQHAEWLLQLHCRTTEVDLESLVQMRCSSKSYLKEAAARPPLSQSLELLPNSGGCSCAVEKLTLTCCFQSGHLSIIKDTSKKQRYAQYSLDPLFCFPPTEKLCDCALAAVAMLRRNRGRPAPINPHIPASQKLHQRSSRVPNTLSTRGI